MSGWDEYIDVAVVGSGAAGLSAAIEVAQAGASVVVFEKMKAIGGNTRISDGGLAAAGIPQQRSRHIEDSPELFLEDMCQAGLDLNHRSLAAVVAREAAGAVAWTRDVLGVRYLDRLDRFGGHSAARCLTTENHSGADIIRAQRAQLNQLGVEIRTGCTMTGLHRDREGAVQGIEIQDRSGSSDGDVGPATHVRAAGGVVLATGGFGADVGFRALQNPRLDATVESTNQPGATAEGLSSALTVGALPVHLSWIQTGPWGCPDERGYGHAASFASYAVYPTGIVVDPAMGRRIMNEWADRRERSNALFAAGHPCIGLVDAAGAEKAEERLPRLLKRGTVRAFDTLRDLATAYEIPAESLVAAVSQYNHRALGGQEDHFGKPLDRRRGQPIETPPFYAVRQWPKVHYTPGGVGIDVRARVLDLRGRPIPRFFAAGEVCGGVHGAGRLGSCALTECIVFGRIAGREAAALPASLDRANPMTTKRREV